MEEAEDPEPHKEAGQKGPGEGRGRDQHYKNIWHVGFNTLLEGVCLGL